MSSGISSPSNQAMEHSQQLQMTPKQVSTTSPTRPTLTSSRSPTSSSSLSTAPRQHPQDPQEPLMPDDFWEALGEVLMQQQLKPKECMQQLQQLTRQQELAQVEQDLQLSAPSSPERALPPQLPVPPPSPSQATESTATSRSTKRQSGRPRSSCAPLPSRRRRVLLPRPSPDTPTSSDNLPSTAALQSETARSSVQTPSSSGPTTSRQCSSRNLLEQPASSMQASLSAAPISQPALQPSSEVGSADAPGSPMPFCIDPIEYVLDTFDKVIVPSFPADSPLGMNIRVHLLRKLLLDYARHELSYAPPRTMDELYPFVSRCIDSLKLK